MDTFNAESKHLFAAIQTRWDTNNVLNEFKKQDQHLIVYAISAIVCYLLCFMGACSPTHLRILVSLFGLGVVGVAILAGQSLAYRLGYKHSDINATVPFLMLGIGIDDMFVICNSVD